MERAQLKLESTHSLKITDSVIDGLGPDFTHEKQIKIQSAWPNSLHIYAEQCFAKCSNKFESDRAEIYLRRRIDETKRSGEFWTKDWANEPVPHNLNDDSESDLYELDSDLDSDEVKNDTFIEVTSTGPRV